MILLLSAGLSQRTCWLLLERISSWYPDGQAHHARAGTATAGAVPISAVKIRLKITRRWLLWQLFVIRIIIGSPFQGCWLSPLMRNLWENILRCQAMFACGMNLRIYEQALLAVGIGEAICSVEIFRFVLYRSISGNFERLDRRSNNSRPWGCSQGRSRQRTSRRERAVHPQYRR